MKLKIKPRIPAFVEMNMATKVYKDKRKKRLKQRLDREIKDILYKGGINGYKFFTWLVKCWGDVVNEFFY